MEDAHADDDAALLARVAGGDLGALGELYDRHREPVRRFAVRALCGHDDAEDIIQNTFLICARIAERYDGRASCQPWLIGIAARLVHQRSQRMARLGRYLSRLVSTQRSSSDPVPRLEARSALDQSSRALARMTGAKRLVLVMAEVEGISCAEIAEHLGIPLGTVWTRLHHARRELLAALVVEEP